MIQIDVHSAGEIWYTWHVRDHDKPYTTTFYADTTELDRVISPEKEGALQHPSTLADRSAGPHPVSLPHTIIVVEKAKHLLTNMLLWFTGPISPACDYYVEHLLMTTIGFASR
jgi:hypothetical protein